MRTTLLLLAAALCPLLSLAQAGLAAGSYELADGTKGQGQLTYQPGFRSKLVVKDGAAEPGSKAAAKGQNLAPEKVRSFEVGGDHYVLLRSIRLDNGMPMTMTITKKDDFAKVLETGKLELLEYQMFYATSSRSALTVTGRDFQANTTLVYLLRRAGEDNAVMIPLYAKKYREVVLPYFAGRPDLQKQMTAPPTSETEIRALVQAYNTPK